MKGRQTEGKANKGDWGNSQELWKKTMKYMENKVFESGERKQ